MKKISFIIYFIFINTGGYAQYISSTVEQVSSPSVTPGSLNNPIIRVKIDVGLTPIDLYAIFLTTAGSTNPSLDIDSTKVYYTGNSNVFLTTTQYVGGTFPMASGTNYFWVAYDISGGAMVCDTIDAECYTVYVTGGTQTPTVTTPIGYTVVGNCSTGLFSPDFFIPLIKVYPNPASEILNITLPDFQNQWQQIQIFNSMGMLLKQISISQQAQINIADFKSGLYYLHMNDNKLQTQKFMKQ